MTALETLAAEDIRKDAESFSIRHGAKCGGMTFIYA